MRDPFPIVAMLGNRFENERTGWRDMKALVMLTAQAGAPVEAWGPASALADALGVPPDAQEAIYREVYGEASPTRRQESDLAPATEKETQPCTTTSYSLTQSSRTSIPA